MLGENKILEVLAEWFSGLDGNGEESRFANFQDLGGLLGRQRRVETEMLCAMLCREWTGSNGSVRCRIAVGADGEPDVRVELEGPRPSPAVEGELFRKRWRPQVGNLEHVFDGNDVQVRISWSAERIAAHAARVTAALGANPNTMTTVEETQAALEALKQERFDVLELLEAIQLAGGNAGQTQGYLAQVRAKDTAVRAVHNALHQNQSAPQAPAPQQTEPSAPAPAGSENAKRKAPR